MTNFQEAVAFARGLEPQDKIDFLRAVVAEDVTVDNIAGVEKVEGVCGGRARIRQTRIPVWSIVLAKRMGRGDDDILRGYGQLTTNDIENALLYYARNRGEIERDIKENDV